MITTITQNDLDLHAAWLRGVEGGAQLVTAVGKITVDADLRGADLSGADLRGADLSRADLIRANLIRANLSRANLRYANLSEANLSRANLSEADLRGANLTGAEGPFTHGYFGRHHAVAAGGYISIGSERHAYEWWLNNHQKCGSRHWYTADEIADYGAWIELAVARQRRIETTPPAA